MADKMKLPSLMVGRYFKYNGDNETVFFDTDNLTVSLLADVDILSDSALEVNFKKILLDIAKHESFGQVQVASLMRGCRMFYVASTRGSARGCRGRDVTYISHDSCLLMMTCDKHTSWTRCGMESFLLRVR